MSEAAVVLKLSHTELGLHSSTGREYCCIWWCSWCYFCCCLGCYFRQTPCLLHGGVSANTDGPLHRLVFMVSEWYWCIACVSCLRRTRYLIGLWRLPGKQTLHPLVVSLLRLQYINQYRHYKQQSTYIDIHMRGNFGRASCITAATASCIRVGLALYRAAFIWGPRLVRDGGRQGRRSNINIHKFLVRRGTGRWRTNFGLG